MVFLAAVSIAVLMRLNPCNTILMYVSEEEISNMRLELEKYGIQMPAFSKIGGILANELSVDEAACKEKWPFVWLFKSADQLSVGFNAACFKPSAVFLIGLLEDWEDIFILFPCVFFFFLEHDDSTTQSIVTRK